MFQDWFSNLPIRQKLYSLNLGIMAGMSIISLITLLLITFNITSEKHSLATTEAINSFFSNSAIVTQLELHPDVVDREISWMKSIPEIASAGIKFDDVLIAGFEKQNNEILSSNTIHFDPERATIFNLKPENPKIDLVVINRSWFSNALYIGAYISSILVIISASILMFISTRIVKFSLINPIEHLISIAELVISNEDFKARAQKFNQDEVGALVDRFNEMLTRIETRDHQLQKEKSKAEKASKKAQKLSHQTSEANTRLEFEVHVRAKIEKKLTDFQSYLNSIINGMPSALIAMDENFFVTLWNKKATELSGTELESALGYSIEEAFPMLSDHLEDISHALIEQEHKMIERVHYTDLSGETFLLDLMIYPLVKTDSPGSVIRIDDVTEKYRLEEVIVQTEKMMSVGGLAAGMAHEINNPLSAIIQGVQNIERRLSPELEQNKEQANKLNLNLQTLDLYLEQRRINRFLANIKKAGERAAHIVTNMLQFSRQTDRNLIAENMSDVVIQAIDIVSSEQFLKLGDDNYCLIIEKDIEESSRRVDCVRQEIEQVLINLLKNGAHAIEKRSIQSASPVEGRLTVRIQYEDQFCCIQVEDNGSGMDNDIKKRVFEPFFTTKDVGLGTGLGLSVSYFIVTSHHNGQMEVTSTPGQGSVFTVKLPLSIGL